jgi:hypothetical protein
LDEWKDIDPGTSNMERKVMCDITPPQGYKLLTQCVRKYLSRFLHSFKGRPEECYNPVSASSESHQRELSSSAISAAGMDPGMASQS